jgi:16S rRNA (uracil1498-N3)-methyltransferase
MHRFYLPSQNISGDKIIISDKAQIHHLADVLRLKIAQRLIVFDEKGNEYKCAIKELLKDKAILELKEKISSFKKVEIKITVACAIPKRAKMDDIIDKLTQLGVTRIIPLLTERVIVKLDKHKRISRLTRWKKIAQNAAQQSQRSCVPVIEPISDIKEVSQASDFDLKLIPTLIDERRPLKDVLLSSKPSNILVLIGPEGDFTPKEVKMAIKAGCVPVTLGELVLRVDTAAIAVASFIRLYADC